MNIPTVKGSNVAEKSRFIGAKVTKATKFMNMPIEMSKLSVQQVMDVQEQARVNKDSTDEMQNFKLICTVVRYGAPDLAEFTDDELQQFALDELTRLSNEIMAFSGLVAGEKK